MLLRLGMLHRVNTPALSQLLHLLLGKLYVHRHTVSSHAIAAHVVGWNATVLGHSLLSHQGLSLLLDENLLLTHLSHRTLIGELVLQLLLLQGLLLSRAQMLECSLKVVVSSSVLLHGRHHGRVHSGRITSGHRVASKLMRHATARRTWLSTVRIHTGTHGMTGYAWMSHAGGMALKVWAHTRGHHSLTGKSAIHSERISTNVPNATACTCVDGKSANANAGRNECVLWTCRQ